MGKGDGALINGASYDATQKELVFDGFLDGLVRELPREFVGDPTLSFSMWINQDSRSTNGFDYTPFLHLGYNATDQRIEFRYDTDGKYCLDGFGVQMRTNDVDALPLGQWMHVCGVLTPGAWSTSTKKLYINGEFVTTVLFGTGTTNIPAETTSATTDRPPMNTSRLELGPRTVRSYASDTYNPTSRPGQLSSIKLYDTALTAEEVKTLYDMGRCDEGHHVVNFSKTRVGIGLGDGEAPRGVLEIRGNVGIGGQPTYAVDGNAYPDEFPACPLHIHQASHPGMVESEGIRFSHPANIGRWNLFISDNNHFRFVYNGAAIGYVDQNDANAQMNFTGQHRTFIKNVPFSQVGELEGLIVSSDQNKYIKMSGGIEVGSNAITTNESLPVVSLSNVATDKKCFGVISASEDPEERRRKLVRFVSVTEKEKGDTRVYINSVGEGAIWVSNISGSLEAGDYITTSNVAGYGQKQDGAGLMNYTVAKITMDCDFEPVTQSTHTRVTDVIENELDEHGQIQWEDHATETEKAYKVRYLAADGTQTDSANVVHRRTLFGQPFQLHRPHT